jgi:O-acetyl-ADP-ribose deacetylase
MSSTPDPSSESVAPEAIEAILAFLPYFADRSNTFYEVDTTSFTFDPYRYADEVGRFQRVLYQSGLLAFAFNWLEWQDTAEEYVEHPDRLARADLTTLRKLLLTHIRKERFSSGHLAEMIDRGHILAILQRLDALHRGDREGT